MPVGHIHTGDPPYAPPLLRAASPSSSIGTDYGPDATSPVEAQMSPDQFSIICEQRLFLKLPKMEEIEANKNPLLPRPKVEKQDMRKYEREMQALHERVMANLRSEVKKLEEDEVFERTVFRDSRFTNTEQPSSNDIDAILKSMMGNLPQPSTSHLSTRSMSPPTQPETNGHGQGRIFGDTPSESEVEAQLSTAVTGRRPPGSRSKGKTRR